MRSIPESFDDFKVLAYRASIELAALKGVVKSKRWGTKAPAVKELARQLHAAFGRFDFASGFPDDEVGKQLGQYFCAAIECEYPDLGAYYGEGWCKPNSAARQMWDKFAVIKLLEGGLYPEDQMIDRGIAICQSLIEAVDLVLCVTLVAGRPRLHSGRHRPTSVQAPQPPTGRPVLRLVSQE